jgi:hypothetical protein
MNRAILRKAFLFETYVHDFQHFPLVLVLGQMNP